MTDEIRLVIPAEEDFRAVAHLVAGGLALRLDLTYDDLEDLQVALEALLGLRDDDGEIVIVLAAAESTMRASIGPLPETALRDLDEDRGDLGLRRVLETVCDSFEVELRDGGAWVDVTKRTVAGAGAG